MYEHTAGETIRLHFEINYGRRIALEDIEIEKAKNHHLLELVDRAMFEVNLPRV